MAKFEFVEWLLLWLLETTLFEFDWDAGNLTKSRIKHGITPAQVEQVFQSRLALPLGIQVSPEVPEERLGIVGPEASGELLMVVFALRNGRVRSISARPAHRKEKKQYEALLRKIAQRI